MNWDAAVARVRPYIVKIDTPSGSGTGYLCHWKVNDHPWCGVATACHVVKEADEWEQPIRIHNHDFTKHALVKETDRFIWLDEELDSAVIFFDPVNLELPKNTIKLRPKETPLLIGNEVGWLGFPGIDPYRLCFFSGNISARIESDSSYLIDGVAINGVSGGPVLHLGATDGVEFIGIVSAYRVNRQRGDALPGLLIAQDVSHAHSVISKWDSFSEARKAKEEEEAKKKQMAIKEPANPTPQDTAPPPKKG